MIQVDHVYKRFAGKPVLEDVSLSIHDGETLALIGRSGSGKSVMMKHLIGLIKPDRGRILVDGMDIHAISQRKLREIRQHFGVLFQGGALFDSMTAFDNVAFPLRTFTDASTKEVRERARRCLELVQLSDIGEKKPAELSGGMQKRVALARAIALQPQYIFYDEPTSGLDPETSNTISELIHALASHLDATNIVVTHDMHLVLDIADRVAFLHEHRLHWVGSIEELHRSDDEVLISFVKANEYQIGTSAGSSLRSS